MRDRTPKTLGTRHDPNYVHQRTRFAYWRRRLGYGMPLAVAALLALLAVTPFKNKRVPYSKGPLSSAHAFIGEKCEACHWGTGKDKKPAGFLLKASDAACLECHEAPAHHAQKGQPTPPSCSSCHAEHQGLVRLSHVQDRACVNCHGNLDEQIKDAAVHPKEARYIHKFNHIEHPEFVAASERMAVIEKKRPPIDIVFHHAKHVGPTLETLKHELVTLQCSDCHRQVASANYTPWNYRHIGLSSAPIAPDSAQHLHPDAGREIMTMPTFEKNCAGCHDMPFDGHVNDSVPHLKSNSEEEWRNLHNFVESKIQGYIDSNPGAIHMPDPPGRGLPEMQALPPASSKKEWVDQHVYRAEKHVLTEWKCNYCHQMDSSRRPPGDLAFVPVVLPSGFKPRQMPFSVFSHEAHTVLNCGACHGDLPEVQGCCRDKTPVLDRDVPDVKLPGIKSCETCHNGNPSRAGNAENSCFLCHQYHKWNERNGTPAKYTFEQLGLPAERNTGSNR